MKTHISLLSCSLAGLAVILSCSRVDAGKLDALEKENAALKAKLQKLEGGAEPAAAGDAGAPALPAALDALYPPKSEQPVFTMGMMGMAMALEAAMADLFEGDKENAKKGFEAFAAQYAKNRELVPEWSSSFPQAPVDEFGKAIASGDPGKVMPAVGMLGAVCHDCHSRRMVAVQHKYHWKDASGFEAKDPVTGQPIGYLQLMQHLGGSFAAIGSNLQQGQKEAAVKQLDAFKARFELLEEACVECHDSERKYYVDESVKSVIDDLAKEVAKDAPDPARVQQLSMSIGEQSCFRCHLVHMPAALSKPRPLPGPPK